jgi:hypothetical protein
MFAILIGEKFAPLVLDTPDFRIPEFPSVEPGQF